LSRDVAGVVDDNDYCPSPPRLIPAGAAGMLLLSLFWSRDVAGVVDDNDYGPSPPRLILAGGAGMLLLSLFWSRDFAGAVDGNDTKNIFDKLCFYLQCIRFIRFRISHEIDSTIEVSYLYLLQYNDYDSR